MWMNNTFIQTISLPPLFPSRCKSSNEKGHNSLTNDNVSPFEQVLLTVSKEEDLARLDISDVVPSDSSCVPLSLSR